MITGAYGSRLFLPPLQTLLQNSCKILLQNGMKSELFSSPNHLPFLPSIIIVTVGLTLGFMPQQILGIHFLLPVQTFRKRADFVKTGWGALIPSQARQITYFFEAATYRIGRDHSTTAGHRRIVRVVNQVRTDDIIAALGYHLPQCHANGGAVKR